MLEYNTAAIKVITLIALVKIKYKGIFDRRLTMYGE